jgi:hypothetical protein
MCYNGSKKLKVEYPATFSGAILLRERITFCNNIWNSWNWYFTLVAFAIKMVSKIHADYIHI